MCILLLISMENDLHLTLHSVLRCIRNNGVYFITNQ